MNCSFNIRYKPRTTRAYTKTDLTVYDSADNTALNALTVYGKSEVVDGAIVSAGEGWATVDLGTLTWAIWNEFFYTAIDGRKAGAINIICETYPTTTSGGVPDKYCRGSTSNNIVYVKDTAYTDVTAFKTAMSGVLLCYQLADPAQGNAIAIKTDNGTGINGTMATFSTGTPLRGIPDTDVRDVMTWYDSSGEVTKNCGEVDLGTLNWARSELGNNYFWYTGVYDLPNKPKLFAQCLINNDYKVYTSTQADWNYDNKSISIGNSANYPVAYIRDDEYTDATDFKTAMSGVKLIYELATPTTEQLTTAENTSIAGLRTFEPQTHAQNNAGATMTVDYTIKVPTI